MWETFMRQPVARTAAKARGAIMLALALLALAGDMTRLTGAMRAIAVAVILAAVVECIALVRNHRHDAGWWLTFADAGLGVAFGALTFSITSLFSAGPMRAIATIDAWLFAHAAFAIVLALSVWSARVPRVVLLAWAALNVVLAIGGAIDPPIAVSGLLYGGALYTGVYGLLVLAGALWAELLGTGQSGRGVSESVGFLRTQGPRR